MVWGSGLRIQLMPENVPKKRRPKADSPATALPDQAWQVHRPSTYPYFCKICASTYPYFCKIS